MKMAVTMLAFWQHNFWSHIPVRKQKTTRHRPSTSMYSLTFYVHCYVVMCTDCNSAWHCCHSNETRVAIANSPNSAQLGGIPTIPPSSYIQIRAVVWACSHGQTDRQTHRRAWPIYILHRLRFTQNVMMYIDRASDRLHWHLGSQQQGWYYLLSYLKYY